MQKYLWMALNDTPGIRDEYSVNFKYTSSIWLIKKHTHTKLLEKKRLGEELSGAAEKSEEVPVAEDVFGVHKVLDGLEHSHSHTGDGFPHPLFPKFAHWMTEKREGKKE